MEQLLELWSVRILYDRLDEHGFDIKSLECIDDSDMKNIFPEKHFYAPIKLFRKSHTEWLRTVKTVPSTSTSESTSLSNSITNEQHKENDSSDSENDQSFNVNAFLKKSEEGAALIKYYEKVKKFSHEDRLALCKLLSSHVLSIKYEMSAPRFKEVANQIGLIFLGEPKDTYYGCINGKSTGLLSVSYYNRKAAEEKKAKKRARETSPEPGTSTSSINDEVKNAMEWMENHSPVDEDDEDVEQCIGENWKFCFKYRTETIEELNGDVEEIFNMWPALKGSCGISLIEDDFRAIHGNNGDQFKDNWEEFTAKNLRTLRKMSADPDVKVVLRNLSDGEYEGTNFYNIEIVLALLHLMEPLSIVLVNKKRFRPTIESAKHRLLKLVDDESMIQNLLSLAKKDREIKALPMFPMIFGIGDSNENVNMFILKLGGFSFRFTKIIEALDAVFKCYIVLKIPFPPEHKRFWSLLNGLFYKIQSPSLEATSAILSSIQSFHI